MKINWNGVATGWFIGGALVIMTIGYQEGVTILVIGAIGAYIGHKYIHVGK